MTAKLYTFATAQLSNRIDIPVRLACPFTSAPSALVEAAQQQAFELGIIADDFRGRVGTIIVCEPDGNRRAYYAFDPISDAAARPLETVRAGYLWPGLEERHVSHEVLVNGLGQTKTLKELMAEIFEPFPQREFSRGGKEQNIRRALWRRALKDALSSPTVKLVRSLNESGSNAWLIGLAEWWEGASPEWEIRFAHTFYPPKSAARFIFEWLLIGIDHDLPAPMQTLESAPAVPVLYEDEHLIVVNKPSRLSSVPGVRETVCAKQILERTHGELFVVHRLDLDTSGVLAFAKTKDALRKLNDSFRSRTCFKRYEARLEGEIDRKQGTIELPLALNWYDRPRQCVLPESEGGKHSVTHFEVSGVQVMPDGRRKSIVSLYLETGRTHQLRVHCAHMRGLNCPIDGDPFYGRMGMRGETPLTRLCLHAAELTIEHPASGEILHVEAPSDFPVF